MTKTDANKVSEDHSLDGLHRRLFEQIDRVASASSLEEVEQEVSRTNAIVKVSVTLVSAGNLALKAYDLAGGRETKLPSFVRLDTQQQEVKKLSLNGFY